MMTVIITLLQMLSSLSGVVQGQEWQLEDDDGRPGRTLQRNVSFVTHNTGITEPEN